MNRNSPKRSRAKLPALLFAACLGAVHGASGCGKAESSRVDSETHWLTRCDSDLDCGAGSCECGVCTEPCVANADCSVLGLSGVECVPASGACSSSAASAAGASSAGAACLLACVDDADCGELGADAVCQSQRCERPARAGVDGIGGASAQGGSGGSGVNAGGQGDVGGTGGTGAAALCDGSDDVRFAWSVGGGFVTSYYDFTASRGLGFLAVDGQCRFWRATGPGGIVYSGTLSDEDAASFASTLDYERVYQIRDYEDPPACTDGGTSVIWTPESRITCSCGPCSDNPSAPSGWTIAFRTMTDPRLDDWFATTQPLTGPARLALIGFLDGPPPEADPLPWPLSRDPAESETYPVVDGTPPLDESSGVEITDPGELSALRAVRATYGARAPGADHTPLVMSVPGTQGAMGFHMLLRDELPAPVLAALRTASGAP